MSKQPVHTDSAPAAIGPYSQAIRIEADRALVFLSGQIPLEPGTMDIVPGDFAARTRQVFDNLKAVCEAAGGDLDSIVKLTIYLTDLDNFAQPSTRLWKSISQTAVSRLARRCGVAVVAEGRRMWRRTPISDRWRAPWRADGAGRRNALLHVEGSFAVREPLLDE